MTPGKEEHAVKPARKSAEPGVDNDPAELGRLLEEAIRCLDSTDLPGANAALKKAHAEAVSHGGRRGAGGHETGKEIEDRG